MVTATLFVPACVSLALCLDSLFNHWFVKEPVGHNHFKLFFGVLRYAIKNKYPHQRSALTYWEDKPYSRIDLAKGKYGGPFTTEQVEDVKIVLRSLICMSLASVGVGLSTTLTYYDNQVLFHLGGTQSSQNCSERITLDCLEFFVVEYFYLFVTHFLHSNPQVRNLSCLQEIHTRNELRHEIHLWAFSPGITEQCSPDIRSCRLLLYRCSI